MTTKLYEISFLARDEAGREKILNELSRFGARPVSEGEFDSTRLAYPIEKLTSAYFGYLHFDVDPSKISELNATLKLAPEVVRFLIVTPPAQSPEPRPRERQPRPTEKAPAPRTDTTLSNELLEEKLGEILKQAE
ncbi:MAG: 30S ribosomal protein S6 [Candidatus Colwellbacteria bacterium]|nr:30S ribosomal protein S6 [Candidatus Colwellbacteria bacterium]